MYYWGKMAESKICNSATTELEKQNFHCLNKIQQGHKFEWHPLIRTFTIALTVIASNLESYIYICTIHHTLTAKPDNSLNNYFRHTIFLTTRQTHKLKVKTFSLLNLTLNPCKQFFVSIFRVFVHFLKPYSSFQENVISLCFSAVFKRLFQSIDKIVNACYKKMERKGLGHNSSLEVFSVQWIGQQNLNKTGLATWSKTKCWFCMY